MLPNTENTDDLILNSVEIQQQKTQTFSINTLKSTTKSTQINGVSCILGDCKLGRVILGGVSTNTSESKVAKPIYYIGSKVDRLAALQQNILLMLSVEADQYIIYPYTYGITTLDLIGKPSYYVMAVIPERIKETLLSDDRITDVTDFEFEINANKLTVKFVVHTIYGDIEEETEVSY